MVFSQSCLLFNARQRYSARLEGASLLVVYLAFALGGAAVIHHLLIELDLSSCYTAVPFVIDHVEPVKP